MIKKKITYKEYIEKLEYLSAQLGTLGGGNHFIEIGKDLEGSLWVTVHSGSRNFGKKVCEHWQKKAKENLCPKFDKEDEIKKIKATLPKSEWHNAIRGLRAPDVEYASKGMEYLENEDIDGYLFDMKLAQEFASLNRKVMLDRISNIMDTSIEKKIESVHNYIDLEDRIIRKGAIRSYKGENCVIPFNMKDGILVCEGKSNEEWNCSAPHGAGRVLSRSQAKKMLDIDIFKDEMNGIFSTSVNENTIDESPMAYKNSSIIEEAIEPTVTVINRIKPIHNLKAGDGE